MIKFNFDFKNKRFVKAFLGFSFVCILVLSGILFTSYLNIQSVHKKSTENLQTQLIKKELLTEMYSVARDRSLILLMMQTQDDPFELDDLNQTLGEQARRFIKSNIELLRLPLSKSDRNMLEEQNVIIQINATDQNEVARLFLEGEKEQATQILFEDVIPTGIIMFNQYEEIINKSEQAFNKDMAKLEHEKEEATLTLQVYAILLFIVVLSFIISLMYYLSKKERQHLYEQINLQKLTGDKLAFQAAHDPLTKLINRREFEIRLEKLLQSTENNLNQSVLYLDLDNFKIINDTCGHIAGDELLRNIPGLISQHLSSIDLLARLGGDEFAIILYESQIEQTVRISQNIINSVSEYQFLWENKIFKVGISIGIVELNEVSNLVVDVLKYADSACYEAKYEGRNRYKIFSPDDSLFKSQLEQMNWLQEVNNALDNNLFVLFAQPIIPIKEGISPKINYEILIRLKHNGNLILPASFLPAAERYNQMVEIDRWVVNQSIQNMQKYINQLDKINHISINLSGQSLANKGFVDDLIDVVKSSGLAHKICFEITETEVINNISLAKEVIKILREMGVRFSLDDFGSGVSSFSYLKNLEVDYLKIDGAFIKEIERSSIDRTMVESIRNVTNEMSKQTVAEFVENDVILEILKDIGIDYAQGYGVGKPVPFSEIFTSTN